MTEPLPNTIDGMARDETTVYRRLLAKLLRKRSRNRLRTMYYRGHNELHDLGYSLPPVAHEIEMVVGWPEKAVECLVNRVVLDGVTTQDGSELSDLVTDIMDANNLAQLAENTHTDALVHSCSFVAALKGDPSRGEPEAVLQEFAADTATGTWDGRVQGLTEALLFDIDEDETYGRQIRGGYLMTRDWSVAFARDGQRWIVTSRDGSCERIACELFPYKPDGKRPFGRSRIDRVVMSLTDEGVRSFMRGAMQAELYSVPPRYLLGATEDMFKDVDGNLRPRWSIMLDQFLAIPSDNQGKHPEIGQLAQASFEPHIAWLNAVKADFASHTSLTPESMGVYTANPSSAEAIDRSLKELCLNAESCQRLFAPAWKRIIERAQRIAGSDGTVQPVSMQWRNPATPSRAAAADAAVKLVAQGILPADSDVTWDMLDLSDQQRRTLRREQRERRAQSLLDRIDERRETDNATADQSGSVGGGA